MAASSGAKWPRAVVRSLGAYLVRRTQEGERTHRRAEAVLAGLEDRLAERIGGDADAELRAALETTWGSPVAPVAWVAREDSGAA